MRVGEDRSIRNVFNQPAAKQRRRNAKDQIAKLVHHLEIGSRKVAVSCIRTAANREESVDAPITSAAQGAIRVDHKREARLSDRPIRGDEKGNPVLSATRGRGRDLRIWADIGVLCGGRTAATKGRLRMTTGAAVGIECGAKAIGDLFHFLDAGLTVLEVLRLAGCESAKRLAGTDVAGANSRIPRGSAEKALRACTSISLLAPEQACSRACDQRNKRTNHDHSWHLHFRILSIANGRRVDIPFVWGQSVSE